MSTRRPSHPAPAGRRGKGTSGTRALAGLLAIERRLWHGATPGDLAREIADRLRQLLGARAVVLRQLPSGATSTVSGRLAGRGGPPPDDVLTSETGVARLALAEGRAIATADVLTDPRLRLAPGERERLRRSTTRAVLALPLLHGGRRRGLLAVWDHRGRRFRPSEIALGRAFADHAVVLLETARLQARVRAERAEAEVAASEARSRARLLEATMEHLDQGVSATDGDLRPCAWNARFLDLLGVPREAARPGMSLASVLHHEALIGEPGFPDQPEGRRAGELALTPASAPQRLGLLRPDGTRVEVSGAPLPSGRLVATCTGASERHRQEAVLERCATELRRAQRLEVVGEMSRRVAHDLNNLLTVIAGRSEILLRRLEPDDPLRRHVDAIEQAVFRAADLVRQLLSFGRKEVCRPRVLDLGAVVAGAEDGLRRLVGERIDLVTRYAPSPGRVKADPGQIEQVITNLALNARDAMPGGGQLRIETGTVELDDRFVMSHPGAWPGAYVRLTVADTGIGMEAETRSRIFEPFFTTKPAGQATGLGLSTVYGIVKQSDGYVDVTSAPGQGARFDVYLPRVEDQASSPAALATDTDSDPEEVTGAEAGAARRALDGRGLALSR